MLARAWRGGACALAVAGMVSAAAAVPALAGDAALIAAARKEGQVVWYTTQIVNQLAVPVAEAFKRSYGIEVRYVRANPNDVALRVINEAKAGRVQADVVDGTATVPALRKAGLILKWQPAGASRLPAEMVDRDGYWVANNVFINTVGYNTELVPRGAEPKSYEDLLRPEWKGRMVWSANVSLSSAPGFVGIVLRHLGEAKGRAYLKALAAQQITSVDVSTRQVLDQVIAGEYAIGLQIFNHHAVISARKGAPAAWVPAEPVTASLSVAAVTAAAPHPSAAKLFVEFLISEAGQKLFRDADYLPADPRVPPKDARLLPEGGRFRAIYFTPEEIEAGMPDWVKIYRELFR